MMKTTNQFYWKFIDTLIYNVATIAAIVVGVSQFLIRAWNENNGNEKVRKVLQTVLTFINTNTERLMVQLTGPEPTPVPVRKVARRRTKRA